MCIRDRRSSDFKTLLIRLHIVGAAVQSVHHNGILIQVFPLTDDNTLLIKGPGNTAGSAQPLSVLVQKMAHLRSRTVTVVCQRLHDHGDAAGAVALID